MRRLFFILVLVTSLPANAGLFDALFDGCDGHRKTLKVGDKLRFSVPGDKIDSDGKILNLGASLFVDTFVGSTRYQWGRNDKVQITGEQIKWLKENYNDNESVDFFATITQMDGASSNASCFVVASFDGLGEKAEEKRKEQEQKKEQEKQCRLDFEAIPEEVGSASKLERLGKRCENSYYYSINYDLVKAKWQRIETLEKSQTQTQSDSRRSQLLAGTIKIQDFRDAALLHQPEALEPIIASPLLKPNSKIYANILYALTLDAQEENNLLRGKISADDGSFYVYLRTNAKTTVFHPDKLRIGASISVIGRYVSNVTYTTQAGAKKMAPVLDVLFIE